MGLFQLVQVQIENGDLHHVGVVVEPGEGLLFEELPLCRLKKRAVDKTPLEVGRPVCWRRMCVKAEMRNPAVPQAGSQTALAGLGIHQLYNHVDDVARGSELPIGAGQREFAQEILVHIPLEVMPFMDGKVQTMNALNDRPERRPVVNLERGTAEEEFAGIGEAGQFMEALDSISDGIEEVVAREGHEVAPSKPRPLAGEDTDIFLVERGQGVILLAQKAKKEQIGNLLDGIHGIVHATRPEDVHQLIDFLTEAGGKEIGTVGFPVLEVEFIIGSLLPRGTAEQGRTVAGLQKPVHGPRTGQGRQCPQVG